VLNAGEGNGNDERCKKQQKAITFQVVGYKERKII